MSESIDHSADAVGSGSRSGGLSADDIASLRPIARPAVLAPHGVSAAGSAEADDAAATAPISPLARLARLLGIHGNAAPDVAAEPDADGRVAVPASSKALSLPRVPGQAQELAYTFVSDGIALPPGGAGYVVEHPADVAVGSSGSRRVRKAPGVHVAIVAYVDAFGRAFSVASPQAMPPACAPDVQFKHYVDADAHTGCVEVSAGGGRTARLAEYREDADGTIAITGSRVELGDAAVAPGLPVAAATAFLALWLLPRRDGLPLASVSVKDALTHLRTADLFEAIDALDADARLADEHALLLPPAVLTYIARALRRAGLVGIKASDLAEHGFSLGGPLAPTPFFNVLNGSSPAGANGFMAAMRAALEATGIPGLAVLGGGPNAVEPEVRFVRTSAYANAFYIGFDRRQVSAEGTRKLLEAESLLNRFVLMVEELDRVGAVQSAPVDQVAQLDAWLIDNVTSLAWPYLDDEVSRVERAATGSVGLDVRLSFARGCESLRLPYRLEYAFRFDAEAGLLVVDVECPSAVLMPREAWDCAASGWRARGYAEREGMASRYALHVMAVIASVAFWSGSQVRQVGVNCWHGFGSCAGVDGLMVRDDGSARGIAVEPVCIATATFEREAFIAALRTSEQREAFTADPFAFIGGVPHVFAMDTDGHLGGVQPLRSLDEPALCPPDIDMRPELDTHALTSRGSDLLHAKDVRDLGIYENAVRRVAAEEVIDAFREGGDVAALGAVKDIHDRTENLLMRNACLRVSERIAQGTYTGESKSAIAEDFSDIYGMQAAMARAAKAVQTDSAAARRQLESIVRTADECGWFADTPTRRYRYFDSYAARALYSARCPEVHDGRDLRLIADEYYLAHYRLATMLSDSLDGVEEAIAHARRCVELAPSVAAGYLRLARCYFSTFDYRSEADVLRGALRIAWNPADVGIALYWLGYALCMLGELDGGFACYQVCIRYDSSLVESAATEAAEFARKESLSSPRTFSKQEEARVLLGVEVDLGLVDANVAFLIEAAGAAVDARSYGLARNLLTSAEMSLHDDAMPPVLESLEE